MQQNGGFGSGAKTDVYAAKVSQYQREYARLPVCNMTMLDLIPKSASRILDIGCCMGGAAVSYTHLTLPTNREV